MKTYNLYIGANNTTGELELDKIRDILDRNFSGYTIVHSVGAWEGQREPSVIVTLASSIDELMNTIRNLKDELAQDAIGIQEVNVLRFI